MKQQYILYSNSTPFQGYIHSWGFVNSDEPPDGSTIYEYIQRKLLENSDLRLNLRTSYIEMTNTVRETKKFRPSDNSLVTQDPGDMTPQKQSAAVEASKAQALIDNLPSWDAVSSAVDGIGSLADAKVFLKKLARVVYWLAKNAEA